MKFLKSKTCIIVICMCVLYLCISCFFSTNKVKYDLTDCVRYFDDAGRYRLMLVADTYFFVDSEGEYEQKSNIIQYHYDNDIFYAIYLLKNQKMYFVFNIRTGETNDCSDINLLSAKEAIVFNSRVMIQLDKPNKIERQFRKFIPLKYRKK